MVGPADPIYSGINPRPQCLTFLYSLIFQELKSQEISNLIARARHSRRSRDVASQLFRGVIPATAAAAGSLACRLDRVTTGAQRLQVVAVVIAFWKRYDVVHQHGGLNPACLGAVAAQRLLGENSFADSAPHLLLAEYVSTRTLFGLSLSSAAFALLAFAASDYAVMSSA